jgi:cytochrome d ubiquinol oxidase subunit I
MHFIATLMVALGSIFSAVWIVVANSWQQTPAGFRIDAEQGRAVVTNFWDMVLNPSSLVRLGHVVLGAFILGAFFVMSISAWYVLKKRHLDFAKKTFSIALVFGAASSLLMLVSGHFQARSVARHQPAKLAAIEGHFHTGPADLHLFGLPDPEEGRVRYGVGIPGGLSLLVHDSFTADVTGLDKFRPEDRPPVRLPFFTYHLMVGLGSMFIALTLFALFLRWRGTLFEWRRLMWVFVFAVGGAYAANQAGWVTAEVGRQPFVVYPEWEKNEKGEFRVKKREGVEGEDQETGMRTHKGLSNKAVVGGDQVLSSIVMFGFIYVLLFAVWLYVVHSKIRHGPDEPEQPRAPSGGLLEAMAPARADPSERSLTGVDS